MILHLKMKDLDYLFCSLVVNFYKVLANETAFTLTSLPGDNRALVPPDPISNSEVKRSIADDSVGVPM